MLALIHKPSPQFLLPFRRDTLRQNLKLLSNPSVIANHCWIRQPFDSVDDSLLSRVFNLDYLPGLTWAVRCGGAIIKVVKLIDSSFTPDTSPDLLIRPPS